MNPLVGPPIVVKIRTRIHFELRYEHFFTGVQELEVLYSRLTVKERVNMKMRKETNKEGECKC